MGSRGAGKPVESVQDHQLPSLISSELSIFFYIIGENHSVNDSNQDPFGECFLY